MRKPAEIVLGTNIGFVTTELYAKYYINHIAKEHRVCNQSKPPHSYTQPQSAIIKHRQPQAAPDSDKPPKTATDRRQLALLFSHSINYEYDSRHGLLFHLLRQNTSDTHMGCTTLNNFFPNWLASLAAPSEIRVT